jgi:hypothetical protein
MLPRSISFIASRKPYRGYLTGVAWFGCVLLCLTVWADENPSIEVASSAQEIFAGESLDFQVEVKNVENPEQPDVSALNEKFEVAFQGDQSRNQSSTIITGGRVIQQNEFSHVYLYRLTPKQTGDFEIPAVQASTGSETLTSETLTLRVEEPEVQDIVLIETVADRKTVYPSQSFTVTLKVLIKPLPEKNVDPLRPLLRQLPHLQINWVDVPDGLTSTDSSDWLQSLVSEDGTGFTLNEISASSGGFFGRSRKAVFDLAKGRETRDGLSGQPIEYFVYELPRRFAATKVGDYSFGPAVIKGTFVSGLEGQEFSARRLVSIAPAIKVTVQEVPSPRPGTYSGAIGKYQVAASASPQKLRVGDPLTLILEYAKGKDAGSIESVSAPDLTTIPDIVSGFDVIDQAPTGRIDGDVKTFSYGLRPKRAGVTIPALAVATFDPDADKFVFAKTNAIPIEVTEASKLTANDLVGSLPTQAGNGIQKNSSGIFQNITDPTLLVDERVDWRKWLGLALGIWTLAGFFVATRNVFHKRASDTIGMRRSKAKRVAQSKLDQAKQHYSQGRTQEALAEIRASIIGLVADTRNQVAQGLTSADVRRALIDAGVPEADQNSTLGLLQSIEDAQYGSGIQSGSGTSPDILDALETSQSLIDRIYSRLARSNLG